MARLWRGWRGRIQVLNLDLVLRLLAGIFLLLLVPSPLAIVPDRIDACVIQFFDIFVVVESFCRLHLPGTKRIILLALHGRQRGGKRSGGNLGHVGSRVGPVRRETSHPAPKISTKLDTDRERKITLMGEFCIPTPHTRLRELLRKPM